MEENKSSNRRSFVRKLLSLGAAAGGATTLLALKDLPKASAAEGDIVHVGDEISGATSRTYISGNTGDNPVIEGNHTATSGYGIGVRGTSASPTGKGVYGYANANTGTNIGVLGFTNSIDGIGVIGIAVANSGSTKGVQGDSWSATGRGVFGSATALTGINYGVYGQSDSMSGTGVYGVASRGSGYAYGVYGHSDSINGRGVFGYADALSGSTFGVYGASDSNSGMGVSGSANATSGTTYGVYGWSRSPNGACIFGQAGGPSTKPIVAMGTDEQTANLQEWWDVSGTPLAAVSKDGWLGVGVSGPARSVHLRGNNACFRMDRDTNSSAFILVRTALGNFSTIWKTFYVGVDATGVDDGEFFIGDNHTNVSGTSTKRFWIDNTGGVHAPNFITGDMKLANDYKVTEDEKDGVAFLNPEGRKIAVLDREGNFHMRGKVVEDL